MRRLRLLLLVATCIHVIDSVNQDELKTKMKAGMKIFRDNLNEIRVMTSPFLSLIPVFGPLISALVDLPLGVASIVHSERQTSLLEQIKSQFEDLKIDRKEEHAALMMATDNIHKYGDNIAAAWGRYKIYINHYVSEKNRANADQLSSNFVKVFKPHELVLDHFANRLTDGKFIKLLVDHSKCHDNELVEFTVWANSLLVFANAMTRAYYQLEPSASQSLQSHFDNLIYSSSRSLFRVRKECLAKIENNVRNDLKDMLTAEVKVNLKANKETRQKVANNIHNALAKAYPFYDWLVVVYKTKDAKSPRKCITNVQTSYKDDEFTVGVHRALKGSHTQGHVLHTAIEDCLDKKKIECDKVTEKLTLCNNAVGDRKLSDFICAVHIYRGDPNLSVDGLPTTSPAKPDPRIPNFYEGECKHNLLTFKFVVTFKSVEQASQKDDCYRRDCGRGTCEVVDLVGLCTCDPGYYGQKCREQVGDYKPEAGKVPRSQSPPHGGSASPSSGGASTLQRQRSPSSGRASNLQRQGLTQQRQGLTPQRQGHTPQRQGHSPQRHPPPQ